MWSNPDAKHKGFTILEVIIALTILGIGMVGIIQLFPMGLQASVRAENDSRAAILAQQILQSLKADPHDLPFIEGTSQLFAIPGDGFDNDERLDYSRNPGRAAVADRNFNRRLDMDFDGGYVDRVGGGPGGQFPDGIPDFRQPVPAYNYAGLSGLFQGDANGDGDPYYDPENFGAVGIDEEYADGRDNDGDGLIDEDTMLATNFHMGNRFLPQPFGPGDGLDNDGDGEPGSPTVEVLFYQYPPQPPQRLVLKMKDGIDNNGDGRIDEGIDEEIFDGLDNDGDGLIDEDCRLPAYPYMPVQFLPTFQVPEGMPDELKADLDERLGTSISQFAWQVMVGRVSDGGGDGLDNDGDGRIDEDPRDGIDNDGDGLIDEDPSPMPLPGFRKVVVKITWGGDLIDNDNDGWVDEEIKDGIDNDLDGRIDEDLHEYFYELTGFIQLKARS